MTPEGLVKKEINKILDAHGAFYRMVVPTGYGKKELDYHLIHSGRGALIEAKRPGKDSTAFQKNVRREAERAGAKVFLITGQPEEYQELIKWLEGP